MGNREPEEVLADIVDQWMGSIWGDSMEPFDRRRLAEQMSDELAERIHTADVLIVSRADVSEVVWLARKSKKTMETEAWRKLEDQLDVADMTPHQMQQYLEELRNAQ